MNRSTDSITSSEIKPPDWPRFYKLYEHERFHTVLMLPNRNALLEVESLMQKGRAACTHRDQLNPCIWIERTTIEEWLATHPAENAP